MKKKRLNKKLLIFLAAVIIVVVLWLLIENKSIIGYFLGIGKKISTSMDEEININYGNIEQVLTGSSLIKDLPADGSVLLRFYNFNTGERQWEKSYILKKGEAKEGFIENPDITIAIHSKYLEQLTNNNFCSVIQFAKKNGDLGTESKLSTVRLLWKFRGMLKYRECFGF